MAKDNFWKNPAITGAVRKIARTNLDSLSDAHGQFTLGEQYRSPETADVLKVTGKKYPSELDLDLVNEANKEWYNIFDSDSTLDRIRTWWMVGNRTVNAIKNRLIGMTIEDPRLNAIIFNDDGSINEANLDRIARVASAKVEGSRGILDFITDPTNENPDKYYINSDMDLDQISVFAENLEDDLGNTENYLNYGTNYSGALKASHNKSNEIWNSIKHKSRQQDKLIEAAKAGSLANNDVEATIGGDPVSVLPSYVQASYKKTPEEEKEEQLLKLKQDNQADIDRLVKFAIDDFNANKKDLAWWL